MLVSLEKIKWQYVGTSLKTDYPTIIYRRGHFLGKVFPCLIIQINRWKVIFCTINLELGPVFGGRWATQSRPSHGRRSPLMPCNVVEILSQTKCNRMMAHQSQPPLLWLCSVEGSLNGKGGWYFESWTVGSLDKEYMWYITMMCCSEEKRKPCGDGGTAADSPYFRCLTKGRVMEIKLCHVIHDRPPQAMIVQCRSEKAIQSETRVKNSLKQTKGKTQNQLSGWKRRGCIDINCISSIEKLHWKLVNLSRLINKNH